MIYAKSYYKRPLKLHMHFSELEQSGWMCNPEDGGARRSMGARKVT